MKQYEAVIDVMEKNGGYATLGFLNQKALKVKDVEWKTKTPFASIRRIVQDERFFFKIKPGLWALKSWRKRLPDEMKPGRITKKTEQLFTHSYYQGLAVQIGNIKRFETFIPAQDKNKKFLGKNRLAELATITKMPLFSYPRIVNKAKTVDVVWLNSRRMLDSIFEIEYSTDMKNSLVKFAELQDFRVDMVIVADDAYRNRFKDTIALSAFGSIEGYVRFLSYNELSQLHSKLFELEVLENRIHRGGPN